MLILVFDTETTGLPNTKILDSNNVELWPSIVQFSYILYDTDKHKIIKKGNYIINIPDHVIISPDAIKVHKITKQMCELKGTPIKDVLDEFHKLFLKADIVIGHNIEFDLNMIKSEYYRIMLNECDYNCRRKYLKRIEKYNKKENICCTMKETSCICNIKACSKIDGKEFIKFPKLVELHFVLFGITPKGAHNALNDVLICLRCFCKLKYGWDICEMSDEVNEEMKKLL
jgi:DNA polymerase III epsilon subunit-like protein